VRLVTSHSFRTRSAMRAATALRWLTWPARLATRNESTATGMTIAMNASAASTSTSVKPARARFGLAALSHVRDLISQSVCGLGDPDRGVQAGTALVKLNGFRTRLAHEPVRRKTDGRQARRLLGRARADVAVLAPGRSRGIDGQRRRGRLHIQALFHLE